MAKWRKTETLVGLFLLLGFALIGGGIVYLGDFRSEEKTTYPIRIIYQDSAGLIKGSHIRLGGALVGKVSSQPQLTDTGNSVVLEARIENGVRIQRGSEFRIDMKGVLGDKYIDIVPPAIPRNDFIKSGEVIMGHSQSDFAKIRENAVTVSTELANLLKKFEENSDTFIKTAEDISSAARELSEASRRINQGILSDKNLQHLENLMSNLDKGSSDVPELVADAKTAVSELKTTLTETRSFVSELNKKLDTIDEGLVHYEPAMKAFKETAENASLITRDLNKGKGAMGLLLKDAKFRKEFEDFIRNLRDYGILRYRNPNEPAPLEDPRSGYSGSRR